MGSVNGGATFSVTSAALSTITVSGPSTVVAGNAASFTAAGADEYGNPVTIAPTWSVSSGSISAGSVTEKADGSYTVTATVGSVNGGATFSVTSAALSTITVSGPSTVVAGNAASFTAAGADEYGNPVTIAPTWSVSSGSISAGSVTEKADGSYTVTATVGSVNGGATFSVTSAALSTITVTQGDNGVIASGTTGVSYGGSQVFTITPNVGYYIVDVVVNGNSVGAVSSIHLHQCSGSIYYLCHVCTTCRSNRDVNSWHGRSGSNFSFV